MMAAIGEAEEEANLAYFLPPFRSHVSFIPSTNEWQKSVKHLSLAADTIKEQFLVWYPIQCVTERRWQKTTQRNLNAEGALL